MDGDIVFLEGRCTAEDAETLLCTLQDHPGSAVDLSGVRRMHMAVVQIVLALAPTLRGVPADPFLARNIFPQIDLL